MGILREGCRKIRDNLLNYKKFCNFALGIPHQCREKQGGTQETDDKPRHTDKRDANNISLFL